MPSGWNTLQLCAVINSSGSWSLSLDGSPIGTWNFDNGSTGVGRVQIGETSANTSTMAFDDVIIDPNHIG